MPFFYANSRGDATRTLTSPTRSGNDISDNQERGTPLDASAPPLGPRRFRARSPPERSTLARPLGHYSPAGTGGTGCRSMPGRVARGGGHDGTGRRGGSSARASSGRRCGRGAGGADGRDGGGPGGQVAALARGGRGGGHGPRLR